MSRTDPDATVISRRRFDMHLAYKAHMAVSGVNGQVVTAATATTGARSDEHQLAELLEHHNKLTRLPAREVVADAKYGTIANYEFLTVLATVQALRFKLSCLFMVIRCLIWRPFRSPFRPIT